MKGWRKGGKGGREEREGGKKARKRKGGERDRNKFNTAKVLVLPGILWCLHFGRVLSSLSLIPRPCGRRKDGLVSTACAFATIPGLFP